MADDQELVIRRTFEVPRELVWRSWTEPERVRRWWGPKDITSCFTRIDLRVGGSYLFCMHSPEGWDFWSTGVYRELDPPSTIVFTDSFSDERGTVVPATLYGMSQDIPLELVVRVTFEEHDGATEMTLRHLGIPEELQDQARRGWNESFDKLAAALK